MVISAMFQSENKTVAETNQQQENQIVEQEDTLPSLQERKQLWQALEQKQKQQQQQQQQDQGEKIKFTNNHSKILIGNKKQQQQQQQNITTNQTGVSCGEYYVAVGKLPKSPSFHSGLDLLADDDDKCVEQANNGGHDYANTDDSRHFIFNSKTTTATTNGRANISHENLINMSTTLQQQQAKQINSTMSTPTTTATNVNNSTPTMLSTAVPTTTVATITISSTLVSTLAQQFSTNIKTTSNNLVAVATATPPPPPPTTTTVAAAASAVALSVTTTTTTNGESSTATTSLFTASYKV